MPCEITCASALPGKSGNTKITFSLAVLVHALPEFNQSLLDFFKLFDLRHILTPLYDSLKLVINAFSLGVRGNGSGERKSTAIQQLDCVARTKRHDSALSSGFPLSQGNAEALDR